MWQSHFILVQKAIKVHKIETLKLKYLVHRVYVAQTEIHKHLIAQIADSTAAFLSPEEIWRRS
jgi:hypothetical protein